MNINAIESVCHHTNYIVGKYTEIMKITGERFNIFRLLNVSSQEVDLHSALIAELLNPSGSHDCGKAFLESFIEIQKRNAGEKKFIINLQKFDPANCSVKVEYHIGFKNEDASEGGRIDILLKDKCDSYIIIENKVLADDQEKQLLRYHNFNKTAAIFYLTLSGTDPSELSKGNLQKDTDFVCISYKEDIIQWLEGCMKIAVKLPILRETIQQYIYLIKHLTGKTLNNNMANEITNLMLGSDEYLEAAYVLQNNIENVKMERAKEIKLKVEEKLLVRNVPCEISRYYYNFPRIDFYPDGWTNHLIGFTVEKGRMFFGIKRVDEKCQPVSFEQIRPYLGNDWKTSSWWLCWRWENDLVFDIASSSPWLKKNIEPLTNEIVNNVNDIIITTKNIVL